MEQGISFLFYDDYGYKSKLGVGCLFFFFFSFFFFHYDYTTCPFVSNRRFFLFF